MEMERNMATCQGIGIDRGRLGTCEGRRRGLREGSLSSEATAQSSNEPSNKTRTVVDGIRFAHPTATVHERVGHDHRHSVKRMTRLRVGKGRGMGHPGRRPQLYDPSVCRSNIGISGASQTQVSDCRRTSVRGENRREL